MKRLLIILLSVFACNTGENGADAYGNFESDEIYVSAETSGKILEIYVDEGQSVEQGDRIARLDTTQLFLQKGQIQASVNALFDKLQDIPVQLQVFIEQEDILEREVSRLKNLVEKGAAPEKQLDDLTGQLKVVRQQKKAMQSQLSTANQGLLAEIEPMRWKIRQLEDLINRSIILSPSTGTILEQFRQKGEVTSIGMPLIKMANLETLTLRAFVSGDQLSSIKLGNFVSVRIDKPEGATQSYNGKITWIADQSEFTPKTIQTKSERVNLVYAVKIEVPNDGSLKIGMPAEVTFNPESNEGN